MADEEGGISHENSMAMDTSMVMNNGSNSGTTERRQRGGDPALTQIVSPSAAGAAPLIFEWAVSAVSMAIGAVAEMVNGPRYAWNNLGVILSNEDDEVTLEDMPRTVGLLFGSLSNDRTRELLVKLLETSATHMPENFAIVYIPLDASDHQFQDLVTSNQSLYRLPYNRPPEVSVRIRRARIALGLAGVSPALVILDRYDKRVITTAGILALEAETGADACSEWVQGRTGVSLWKSVGWTMSRFWTRWISATATMAFHATKGLLNLAGMSPAARIAEAETTQVEEISTPTQTEETAPTETPRRTTSTRNLLTINEEIPMKPEPTPPSTRRGSLAALLASPPPFNLPPLPAAAAAEPGDLPAFANMDAEDAMLAAIPLAPTIPSPVTQTESETPLSGSMVMMESVMYHSRTESEVSDGEETRLDGSMVVLGKGDTRLTESMIAFERRRQ